MMKENDKSDKQEYVRMCPLCKSSNVDLVNSATIGCEIFITFRCLNCGNEEILDDYQIKDWFNY